MSRKAAFSLVETMCAIMILGIGVAGLTHGITSALVSSKESELQTKAALLAAGQIETLRADGFVIEGTTEGECEGLPNCQWKQTITSSTIDGLYEVEVAVEDSRTGKLVYELKTMLFDAPLLPSTDNPNERKGSRDRRDRRGF